MDAYPDIAAVAKLLAEPSRAQMLMRLLDGRALTATELAHHANISPQTASSHLAQLSQGKFLSLEKQGRHRYYRLAGDGVARAIESLMAIAPDPVSPVRSDHLPALQVARTCYDHLAGRLGVGLTDALIDQGWLVPAGNDYEVTAQGEAGFAAFGIALEPLKKQRRQFARQCLDWTERRHHLAGALGAALARTLLDRNWLLKSPSERVVHVTNAGLQGLRRTFGLQL